jgi:hypothetical protein
MRPVKSKREVAPSSNEIREERIATRAYEKWRQRGCPLWQSDEDWFAARAELEKEHTSAQSVNGSGGRTA